MLFIILIIGSVLAFFLHFSTRSQVRQMASGELRSAAGFTLRQVEEKTGGVVKNSYLSQIENGDINRPSPDILYELAGVYGVSYLELLERAGHRVPVEEVPTRERSVAGLPLHAIADLDERDREELINFIGYLQARKRRGK